jgi:hypothetical protein
MRRIIIRYIRRVMGRRHHGHACVRWCIGILNSIPMRRRGRRRMVMMMVVII